MDGKTEGVTSAEMSAVVVRACVKCGGKREIDKPCAGCGNPEPPVTHDLGVQAAWYKDPLRQLSWDVAGRIRAALRVETANREVRGG